ncbi:MAG: HAMP domain-containing histidine kinase [Acidimicrobiia bacterium]|nr:HAMP domain-containing histidine kinase [Acidimicrobiia bacterium]NNC42807.1 HAMP domain-containing histidine kinase [Acidimicrobiia bacterium]NND13099.1 HAMP domain-containing histidine kinase [Acidimicrobiia bacterium]
MFKSFRTRLIATVIALIGLTAGLVGVVSFVVVRSSLRSQLVDDSVARAEFNITVLASTDQLPADAGRAELEASRLTDRFLLRGTDGVFIEFPDGDQFASSLGLLSAGGILSSEMRQIVASGRFGYEFLSLDGVPTLAVGGRRPGTGPDFYFFYPAAGVESALSALARVLLGVGVGVTALGALAAGVIARRVLRPVAIASAAAGRMAEGDLTVRMPAETNDELGRMAIAFNSMAASLEEQIDALLSAHAREQRFTADVSHELRTPLTALVNEAAHLEGRLDELSEPDRQVGAMLVADVGRLRSLVEDLLEVSRLDAGATATDASDVDIARFLEAVIADRHPAATLSIAPTMSRVRTDQRSLERIVGNLLDNAAHHAPQASVAVTATVEDGWLRVTVEDNGPGVSDDELPHLFDRFFKTDPSRQGGSGLGLAIARQHARRLGGDVTARAGGQRGLVFSVEIPVSDSLQDGDVPENRPPQSEGEERLHTRRTP